MARWYVLVLTQYDINLDTSAQGLSFKEAIAEKTRVPIERQKVMVKGGLLKDDTDLSKLNARVGQQFMVLGMAGELPQAPAQPVQFLEDMKDEDLAKAVRGVADAGESQGRPHEPRQYVLPELDAAGAALHSRAADRARRVRGQRERERRRGGPDRLAARPVPRAEQGAGRLSAAALSHGPAQGRAAVCRDGRGRRRLRAAGRRGGVCAHPERARQLPRDAGWRRPLCARVPHRAHGDRALVPRGAARGGDERQRALPRAPVQHFQHHQRDDFWHSREPHAADREALGAAQPHRDLQRAEPHLAPAHVPLGALCALLLAPRH